MRAMARGKKQREIGVGGFAVTPRARRYVDQVLRSNRLSYGPFHRRFEAALPADMDPIREIARRRGLKIVEDSAETMFARYKGRKVGSLGDIGCFSTYVAHYIVTGVGGLATTSDPDLIIRLRSLMNHGRDSI